MKGFALGLAFKQRRNATRKSPISFLWYSLCYCWRTLFFGKQNLVWFCVGVTAQMKALDEKKETTD